MLQLVVSLFWCWETNLTLFISWFLPFETCFCLSKYLYMHLECSPIYVIHNGPTQGYTFCIFDNVYSNGNLAFHMFFLVMTDEHHLILKGECQWNYHLNLFLLSFHLLTETIVGNKKPLLLMFVRLRPFTVRCHLKQTMLSSLFQIFQFHGLIFKATNCTLLFQNF